MRDVVLWICTLAFPVAQAATCSASSGPVRQRLLELYTSEGCSSCPPADQWFSKIPAGAVVPLAFHVDYWDRLGWKDPYAQPAFSARQRARNQALGWVYTPQLMLDGRDWRDWSRTPLEAPMSSPQAQVTLRLTIAPTPQRIDVSVGTGQDQGEVYVALTEDRLTSKVAAGENAHAILHHDHVVRALTGPLNARRADVSFALDASWKRPDLNLVAFALDARGHTLQAMTATASCP